MVTYSRCFSIQVVEKNQKKMQRKLNAALFYKQTSTVVICSD